MVISEGTPGKSYIIKKITVDAAESKHLSNIGFVKGTMVDIVSNCGGNVIVRVKGCSYCLTDIMASGIVI